MDRLVSTSSGSLPWHVFEELSLSKQQAKVTSDDSITEDNAGPGPPRTPIYLLETKHGKNPH